MNLYKTFINKHLDFKQGTPPPPRKFGSRTVDIGFKNLAMHFFIIYILRFKKVKLSTKMHITFWRPFQLSRYDYDFSLQWSVRMIYIPQLKVRGCIATLDVCHRQELRHIAYFSNSV